MLYLIDIDDTIIYDNRMLAVINKLQPSTVLFYIEKTQLPLLKSYWKKYNHKVSYNGECFWLSDDIYNKCLKFTSIENIGISYRECNNNTYNKIGFIEGCFKSLKFKNEDYIGLLTARDKKNTEMITNIKDNFKKLCGKDITYEFFVGDALKKCDVILELLIGKKIQGGKFIDYDIISYDNIVFIDDLEENIRNVRNIQELLEKYLLSTEEYLRNDICSKLKFYNKYIELYEFTNNTLNPFKISKVKLYSMYTVMNFKQYNESKKYNTEVEDFVDLVSTVLFDNNIEREKFKETVDYRETYFYNDDEIMNMNYIRFKNDNYKMICDLDLSNILKKVKEYDLFYKIKVKEHYKECVIITYKKINVTPHEKVYHICNFEDAIKIENYGFTFFKNKMLSLDNTIYCIDTDLKDVIEVYKSTGLKLPENYSILEIRSKNYIWYKDKYDYTIFTLDNINPNDIHIVDI